MSEFLNLTDAYKIDHRRQYPKNTTMVYSNLTARASRLSDVTHVISFGLQFFLQRYLMEEAIRSFFALPKQLVIDDYKRLIDSGLGPNGIDYQHIAGLHDLGHIPMRFFALPEGTHVPLRVPMLTMVNTHPDFAWMTNYIETLMSSVLWPMCTSATMANRYRRLLDNYAEHTGDPSFVQWQGHDFSFRGMMGPEAASLSGAGHLTSFTGTDTLPAIRLLEKYYDARGLVGGSVAATEHSVMCAGGALNELETYERLLSLYPSGIVSVVSDTWDLWEVLDSHLPALRSKIMARDGKLVIRPDSGDPAKILCGDPEGKTEAERQGVVERLWTHFGGTVNDKGHKVLDSHVGAIYGDSITVDRAADICRRLSNKGFASTNVVLGIGSFTYQYTTRDTYGFAIKATSTLCDGKENQLFKDPVTDDGTKRSARGCLRVSRSNKLAGPKLYLTDGLSFEEAHGPDSTNLLREVWRNGSFIRRQTLDEVRSLVAEG